MTNDALATTLCALSRATGRSLDGESFESRLRIQKAVYLFKALGAPAAAGYRFSDYFHGPYSPELAREYYALMREGKLAGASGGMVEAVDSNEVQAAVVEAVNRGNPFMEAVATLHSIASNNPGASLSAIRGQFASLKPHLEPQYEGAIVFLRNHQLIADHT
jgi:uncharacterized protein YwgA